MNKSRLKRQDQHTGSFSWVGSFTREDKNKASYKSLKVCESEGNETIYTIGDNVLFQSESNVPYIAEIEDFYEDKSSGSKFVSARWYYRCADVKKLAPKALENITFNSKTDIFYCNTKDENEPSSILRKCNIIFLQGDEESFQTCGLNSKDTFICRYKFLPLYAKVQKLKSNEIITLIKKSNQVALPSEPHRSKTDEVSQKADNVRKSSVMDDDLLRRSSIRLVIKNIEESSKPVTNTPHVTSKQRLHLESTNISTSKRRKVSSYKQQNDRSIRNLSTDSNADVFEKTKLQDDFDFDITNIHDDISIDLQLDEILRENNSKIDDNQNSDDSGGNKSSSCIFYEHMLKSATESSSDEYHLDASTIDKPADTDANTTKTYEISLIKNTNMDSFLESSSPTSGVENTKEKITVGKGNNMQPPDDAVLDYITNSFDNPKHSISLEKNQVVVDPLIDEMNTLKNESDDKINKLKTYDGTSTNKFEYDAKVKEAVDITSVTEELLISTTTAPIEDNISTIVDMNTTDSAATTIPTHSWGTRGNTSQGLRRSTSYTSTNTTNDIDVNTLEKNASSESITHLDKQPNNLTTAPAAATYNKNKKRNSTNNTKNNPVVSSSQPDEDTSMAFYEENLTPRTKELHYFLRQKNSSTENSYIAPRIGPNYQVDIPSLCDDYYSRNPPPQLTSSHSSNYVNEMNIDEDDTNNEVNETINEKRRFQDNDYNKRDIHKESSLSTQKYLHISKPSSTSSYKKEGLVWDPSAVHESTLFSYLLAAEECIEDMKTDCLLHSYTKTKKEATKMVDKTNAVNKDTIMSSEEVFNTNSSNSSNSSSSSSSSNGRNDSQVYSSSAPALIDTESSITTMNLENVEKSSDDNVIKISNQKPIKTLNSTTTTLVGSVIHTAAANTTQMNPYQSNSNFSAEDPLFTSSTLTTTTTTTTTTQLPNISAMNTTSSRPIHSSGETDTTHNTDNTVDGISINGSLLMTRMISQDLIFTTLHDCAYRGDDALEKLSLLTTDIFVEFSYDEQIAFLSSFSKCGDNIRRIAPHLPQKSRKDILEYYFRYIHSAVQLVSIDLDQYVPKLRRNPEKSYDDTADSYVIHKKDKEDDDDDNEGDKDDNNKDQNTSSSSSSSKPSASNNSHPSTSKSTSTSTNNNSGSSSHNHSTHTGGANSGHSGHSGVNDSNQLNQDNSTNNNLNKSIIREEINKDADKMTLDNTAGDQISSNFIVVQDCQIAYNISEAILEDQNISINLNNNDINGNNIIVEEDSSIKSIGMPTSLNKDQDHDQVAEMNSYTYNHEFQAFMTTSTTPSPSVPLSPSKNISTSNIVVNKPDSYTYNDSINEKDMAIDSINQTDQNETNHSNMCLSVNDKVSTRVKSNKQIVSSSSLKQHGNTDELSTLYTTATTITNTPISDMDDYDHSDISSTHETKVSSHRKPSKKDMNRIALNDPQIINTQDKMHNGVNVYYDDQNLNKQNYLTTQTVEVDRSNNYIHDNTVISSYDIEHKDGYMHTLNSLQPDPPVSFSIPDHTIYNTYNNPEQHSFYPHGVTEEFKYNYGNTDHYAHNNNHQLASIPHSDSHYHTYAHSNYPENLQYTHMYNTSIHPSYTPDNSYIYPHEIMPIPHSYSTDNAQRRYDSNISLYGSHLNDTTLHSFTSNTTVNPTYTMHSNYNYYPKNPILSSNISNLHVYDTAQNTNNTYDGHQNNSIHNFSVSQPDKYPHNTNNSNNTTTNSRMNFIDFIPRSNMMKPPLVSIQDTKRMICQETSSNISSTTTQMIPKPSHTNHYEDRLSASFQPVDTTTTPTTTATTTMVSSFQTFTNLRKRGKMDTPNTMEIPKKKIKSTITLEDESKVTKKVHHENTLTSNQNDEFTTKIDVIEIPTSTSSSSSSSFAYFEAKKHPISDVIKKEIHESPTTTTTTTTTTEMIDTNSRYTQINSIDNYQQVGMTKLYSIEDCENDALLLSNLKTSNNNNREKDDYEDLNSDPNLSDKESKVVLTQITSKNTEDPLQSKSPNKKIEINSEPKKSSKNMLKKDMKDEKMTSPTKPIIHTVSLESSKTIPPSVIDIKQVLNTTNNTINTTFLSTKEVAISQDTTIIRRYATRQYILKQQQLQEKENKMNIILLLIKLRVSLNDANFSQVMNSLLLYEDKKVTPAELIVRLHAIIEQSYGHLSNPLISIYGSNNDSASEWSHSSSNTYVHHVDNLSIQHSLNSDLMNSDSTGNSDNINNITSPTKSEQSNFTSNTYTSILKKNQRKHNKIEMYKLLIPVFPSYLLSLFSHLFDHN